MMAELLPFPASDLFKKLMAIAIASESGPSRAGFSGRDLAHWLAVEENEPFLPYFTVASYYEHHPDTLEGLLPWVSPAAALKALPRIRKVNKQLSFFGRRSRRKLFARIQELALGE